MIIDKNLFDECWCCAPGQIARVCLSGMIGIPKELEEWGREKDGDEYDCSCFSIDIIIEDGRPVGGWVNYMAENAMWSEYVCDNYMEAWSYYVEHVDQETLRETKVGE